MRILIACEESQAVCKEMRRLGHEAYSCDIIPCSGGHPEWHIMEDALLIINGKCYDPEDTLETTGCTRTGCMFCMFGCHLEKEPNRFQRMKETHPKQYAYCMKPVEEGGLGLDAVLSYLKIPH